MIDWAIWGILMLGNVLPRPHLWLPALGVLRRFGIPSREFLAFRAGIYGLPLNRIPPEDLIHYLEWCRLFPGPVR